MYWWKTKELATKIKNDELDEKDKMQYYLAGSLFLLIFTYTIYLTPREGTVLLLAELVSLIVIVIIGIRTTFNSNKGANGHDYVARVICLGFPLMIKIFALAVLAGLLAGMFGLMEESGAFTHESIPMALTLTLEILYFWRLNVHLRYINIVGVSDF